MIVFFVAHGTSAAQEEERVLVVEEPNLIWTQEIAGRGLRIDRTAAIPSPAQTMGLRVDRFLSKKLGEVLVCRGFVAAQV